MEVSETGVSCFIHSSDRVKDCLKNRLIWLNFCVGGVGIKYFKKMSWE